MIKLLPVVIILFTGLYVMKKQNKNIRNNNPLNIKESADWNGESLLNLDKTFEEFKAPEYGFRAGYIILLQYLERGDNTIESIISKWAPINADGNHTNQYIDYVAHADRMQLPKTELITPAMLPELMLYMAKFEGDNIGYFTIEQARKGAELAHKEDFVVARLNRLGEPLTYA